jgi:hypothetical protein
MRSRISSRPARAAKYCVSSALKLALIAVSVEDIYIIATATAESKSSARIESRSATPF